MNQLNYSTAVHIYVYCAKPQPTAIYSPDVLITHDQKRSGLLELS